MGRREVIIVATMFFIGIGLTIAGFMSLGDDTCNQDKTLTKIEQRLDRIEGRQVGATAAP